jgi:transcriptional regulator with XRE-family HTH domain
MDFYSRIRQLVKKSGYSSLQEFICSVDMSRDSYYTLKASGNLPRADIAFKFAKALGVTLEFLISGSDPKPLTADDALTEIETVIKKYRRNRGPDRKKP